MDGTTGAGDAGVARQGGRGKVRPVRAGTARINLFFIGGNIALNPDTLKSFGDLSQQPNALAMVRLLGGLYFGTAIIAYLSLVKREWMAYGLAGVLILTLCILSARVLSILLDGNTDMQMMFFWEESFFVLLAVIGVIFMRRSTS